mgnify:CR=1 FL=1
MMGNCKYLKYKRLNELDFLQKELAVVGVQNVASY